MGEQVEGFLGRAVDRMIRRAVRRSFHSVYWIPPTLPVSEPAIFVPNHHGWHDGYVMYLALSQLGLGRFHDWIQEYDAFPLFGKIGGMPFPQGDAGRRAQTIRHTIRLMREERRNLMLFAEGVLHRPPELMPFGKSLDLLIRQVPEATVYPVAIRYELAMHERPECFLLFGAPVEKGPDLRGRTRLEVSSLLDRIAAQRIVAPESFTLLHRGTHDVNERWDMRKFRGRTQSPGP